MGSFAPVRLTEVDLSHCPEISYHRTRWLRSCAFHSASGVTLASEASLASVDPPCEHSPIAAEPARSLPSNLLAVSLRSSQSEYLFESPYHQPNCHIAGELIPHFHYATTGA